LFVILAILLCGFSAGSHAHDPRLSLADVQVREEHVVVRLTFSVQDIEYLVQVDTNHDKVISGAELDSARNGLSSLFADGIRLQLDGKLISAGKVTQLVASEDAIAVNLNFAYHEQDKLSLAVPILSQFARGHLQHLTVRNRNGERVLQRISNAGSGPVELDIAAVKTTGIFQEYFIEGVWHIWIGFDHILFLLTLLLPAVLVLQTRRWLSTEKLLPALTDTLKIVTVFTLAHSITLALAFFEIVQLPSRLVESMIAVSVLVTALNNLRPVYPSSRSSLAFGFGLIHGFGFASVLTGLELPPAALTLSLLGFNLGVEAGQLVIVALFLPVAYLARRTFVYRTWVFRGGSAAAAMIATLWLFERSLNLEMPNF